MFAWLLVGGGVRVRRGGGECLAVVVDSGRSGCGGRLVLEGKCRLAAYCWLVLGRRSGGFALCEVDWVCCVVSRGGFSSSRGTKT